MTQIAILSTDEKLVEMLRSSGLKANRIDATELAGYGRAAEAPQVLVVDMRGRDQLPAGLSAYRRQHPTAGAVLVTATLDPRLMLEAMRAGVNECVAEPLTAKSLDEAVRRVLTNASAEATGQVFAFVGAKGGVGTTTIAVNTAYALGRAMKSDSLLIDMHLGHGDDAVFLGVEPRFSIIDALENIHRVDESFFAGVVEKTDVGVQLLASPTRPRHGGADTGRVRALLEAAAQMYRTTVCDIPRSDMGMLDSLNNATTIVVVTSQEIASLRSAAHMAETLRGRYGAQRVKLVVNRFDKDAVIAQSDMERVLGGSVEYLLPSDYYASIEALNAGRPVALNRDSKLGLAFHQFARDLAGVSRERSERPAGMLSRLAWRRA